MSDSRPPLVPMLLGAAGLIPFVALSAAQLLDIELPPFGSVEAGRAALVGYAIAILSFLGGVRWGLAITYSDPHAANRDYVIAVLPALIGWAALGLDEPADLWLLCGAFVLVGLFDYGLVCRTLAPEWYGRLRLALTAVVTLCLGLAASA